MRCLNCHYDLRQTAERRCSECGRAFDPADPTTFEPESVTRNMRRIWYMLVAICTIFAIGGAFGPVLFITRRIRIPEAATLIAAYVLAVLIVGVILYLKRPRS